MRNRSLLFLILGLGVLLAPLAPAAPPFNSAGAGVGLTATPLPLLTSASPSTEPVGTTNVVVTLTGNGFFGESTVYLNGVAKTTTYISPTSVSFTIPTASMASAGNLVIWVANTSGQSMAILFPVTAAETVTSTTPSSVTAGAGNTAITVSGTGFINPSVVKFNGTTISPVTFNSSTSLSCTIPSTLLTVAGNYPVTVTGATGSATFTVQAAGLAFDDSSLAPTGYETVCALNTGLTVFNAKTSYSAVGDGVADDTVPIRNALAAAVANGSGIVYLPAGTYAVAPQVGDAGQLGPYSVTINAATDVLTSSTSIAGLLNGMTIYFSAGSMPSATGLTITSGLGHWYYVGSISGNTFQLYTTWANAVAGTSPIDFTTTGSGLSVISPQQFHIFTINSSNIVIIGDHNGTTGAPTTFLKPKVIGLLDPVTNWITCGPTNSAGIVRDLPFSIAPPSDISVLQFRSLDIDGGAGYTGDIAWPGNPTTGDGWDLSHKCWAIKCDSNHVDNVLIFNTNVQHFRGEHIFVGGQLCRTSAIIGRAGGDGRNSVWKGTNASCIANSGQWTFVNMYVGGSVTADKMDNGFETQIGPGVFAGESQIWNHVTVEGATPNPTGGNAVSCGNDPTTTLSMSDVIFKNCWVGIQMADTVASLTVNGGTWTGLHYGIRASTGNGTNLTGTGMNNLSFSNISNTGCPFLYLEADETNVALSNISVLSGSLLSGYFHDPYATWVSFTIDGTVFAATNATDTVSVQSGTAAPLWTNSTRPGGVDNCGDYFQFSSGPGPFTITPHSDATRIQNLPDHVGHWQIVMSPLASYPDQYTLLFYVPFYSNAYLKADATWNDFSSDVQIVNGVTQIKYQTSTGKFTQLH